MPRVFICYRREDSADVSGRIRDRLAQHFGEQAVFLDVDSVPYGVDYRHHLLEWMGHCDAVLAVIGPDWLGASYAQGPRERSRRLDNPADPVRLELTAALNRDLPVIPVLVGGATMPEAEEVPESIRAFAYRNAAEVRSGREFHADLERLRSELERLPQRRQAAEHFPSDGTDPSGLGASPQSLLRAKRKSLIGPVNLGFETPSFDGRPVGWSDSLGFVDRASARYEIQVVPRTDQRGGQCLSLSSHDAEPPEFGSVMQRWTVPTLLVGCRLRLEAELRSEDLVHWAGLWLRIDGPDGHLFFENMSGRPIRGSTTWSVYQIEAPIAAGAEWINYGVLLAGRGTLLADSFRLLLKRGDEAWTILGEE